MKHAESSFDVCDRSELADMPNVEPARIPELGCDLDGPSVEGKHFGPPTEEQKLRWIRTENERKARLVVMR